MGNAGLLISARSTDEAIAVLQSGVGWLDLKEPSLGSLGRPDIELVHSVLGLSIPPNVGLSVAGGELRDWQPELNLTLARSLPSNCFLKIALAGCSEVDWKSKTIEISKYLQRPSQLILVYYADCLQSKCPSWSEIGEFAQSFGCGYTLIDTCNKQSGRLLAHCPMETLEGMIQSAEDRGLKTAIAGSIRLDELEMLSSLGPSWIGLRGAVCDQSDRTGQLCPERLRLAVDMIRNFSKIDRTNYVLR